MKRIRIRKWHMWLSASVAMACAFPAVPEGVSSLILWSCLMIFYVTFALIGINSAEVAEGKSTYLTPEFLLLGGSYLILFMPYQAYLLGEFWIDYSALFDLSYSDQSNRSIWASTVGVLAFAAGSRVLRPVRLESAPPERKCQSIRAETLVVGVLLTAVVALLLANGGFTASITSGYAGASMANRGMDGLYFLASMLSVLGIICSILMYREVGGLSPVSVWVGLTSLAWAAVILMLGDRNGFFLVATAAGVAFSSYVRRISPVLLLLLAGGAYVVYEGVEVSRQIEGRTAGDIVAEVLQVNETNRPLDESSLNLSTIVTRSAFGVVPEQYDYFYGKFKIVGFMGVVPFSRGLYLSENDPFATSADFLTFIMIGPNAGWAVGTTIIADIYLDGGVVAIVALMFALGLWGSWVRSRAALVWRSNLWPVLFCSTAALYAEIARYSFDFPIRNLVWTALLFFVIGQARQILRRSSSRNA